ncbi:MAG TPA: DUF5916 domain-containing protein [Rhodothermia bacterium]|nr:DUF5916 domain-containing protein [Rhodothermia bacterium]
MRPPSRLELLSTLIVTFSLPRLLPAQSEFVLPRIDRTVYLDGRVTDEEWSGISPLPLTVYEPVYQAPPSQPTELRVAYDNDFLYVAARLYDAEPDQVRANTLYRDRYSGDDTFGIIIDAFNDNENGLWFFTTPNGIRVDMALANDVNFDGPSPAGVMNSSWNTYWDVATASTPEGWFGEMRIPYSSLGFQSVSGRVTMGMMVYRYIARNAERQMFPSIPPKWAMGFAKPSQAQDIVLEGVIAQKPMYVTPYVLTGGTKTSELNDAETAYLIDDDFKREVGVDVKYTVTSNLTLDLTANTDFAQVEADNQQVNFTRFDLFFPEKRQFFQERSSVFDFNLGFQDRLFHSRQIGVHDGGLIRILGGARLVGRVGHWDVGVVNMQTDDSIKLPSENLGVARLRRRVINKNSTVGGMVTSRVGDEGSYNVAYGLDAILRVTGDEYAKLTWAQSWDDDVLDVREFDFVESGQVLAEWQRRRSDGLNYTLMYKRVGRDFEPGMGFKQRENITHTFARAGYGWFASPEASVLQFTPYAFTSLYLRNDDGTFESAFFGGGVDASFKNSAELHTGFEWSYENIRDDTLTFPEDTEILPGNTFRFIQMHASYQSPEGTLVRGLVGLTGGSFFGGTRFGLTVEPTWNASEFVELAASYDIARITLPDPDTEFWVHLTGMRAQIGFDRHASINGFIQYNSADDLFSANVRFRYNFREGNDLWLVYNEGSNLDRDGRSPRPPAVDNRAVLVKYTHTFGS